MFTRIDHVMVCVSDLRKVLNTYTERLGFYVYHGGSHPGRGTHNAVGFFDQEYLELLGVRDRAELERDPRGGVLEFLEKGEGLRFFILASDDIDQAVASLRARGVEVRDVREGSRKTPDGAELRWRYADLGEGDPLPFFLIQHLTPDTSRRAQAPQRAPHPNGALVIDRVAVAVANLEAATQHYERAMGFSTSPICEEPLLGARTVCFSIGKMSVALAEPGPVGDGPAREALMRHGSGPFLLSLQTTSLADTERWMLSHHVNIAGVGARGDGKSALLTRPEAAHGMWMGWVAG